MHFFAGPKSRAYPGASICHAVLFGFSSGNRAIARAIIELAINASHSCLMRARRLQSNLSSLRCARAAAMRVDANEPTNLETAKTLWAQQKSGNARPAGRRAHMQSSKSISFSYS